MCDPTSFVTKLGDIVSQTLPVCMPPKDQHELKPAFGRKKTLFQPSISGVLEASCLEEVPRFHSQRSPKDSGTVHGRVCSSCLTHGACGLGVSRRSKVGGDHLVGPKGRLVVKSSLVTGFQPSSPGW